MLLKFTQKRAWAEINLDLAKYNFDVIREQVGNKTKICCVIKANAYGHGAITLAKLYQENGADYFAVSNIEEALQLRNNNIVLPILILGYTPTECALTLAKNDITQCIYSLEYAIDLSKQAAKSNCTVKVHLKLDTGMGRIGFKCTKDDLQLAEKACRLPNFF